MANYVRPDKPSTLQNITYIEWHYMPNDFPEDNAPVYIFAKRIIEETGKWEEVVFDNCKYNNYDHEWCNERGWTFDLDNGTFKILAWAYAPDGWNLCDRNTRFLITNVRDAIDKIVAWGKENLDA